MSFVSDYTTGEKSTIEAGIGTSVTATNATAAVNVHAGNDSGTNYYYKLPEPSVYEGFTATVVKEVQTSDGVISFNVSNTDVAKVTVEWKLLSGAQWAAILTLFSSKDNFVKNVKFINQTTNAFATRQMYVSDRTSSIYNKAIDGNGNPVVVYQDCKIELIDTRKR